MGGFRPPSISVFEVPILQLALQVVPQLPPTQLLVFHILDAVLTRLESGPQVQVSVVVSVCGIPPAHRASARHFCLPF